MIQCKRTPRRQRGFLFISALLLLASVAASAILLAQRTLRERQNARRAWEMLQLEQLVVAATQRAAAHAAKSAEYRGETWMTSGDTWEGTNWRDAKVTIEAQVKWDDLPQGRFVVELTNRQTGEVRRMTQSHTIANRHGNTE